MYFRLKDQKYWYCDFQILDMSVFILSSLLGLEYWDCKIELQLSKDIKFNRTVTVQKGAQKTVMK